MTTKTDSERLDFMIKHGLTVFRDGLNGCVLYSRFIGKLKGRYDTPREAIDAAMEAGE